MPSCFRLISKETNEVVSLIKVDEEICQLLGVEVDLRHYGGVENGFNWFDTIGFMIATNSEMFLGSQKLRDHYLASDMWSEEAPVIGKILNYLEEKYRSANWYQSK